MPYKLSQRFNQDSKIATTGDINLGAIVKVLIVFAAINLLTAFVFSAETGKVASYKITPPLISSQPTEIGPINIKKDKQSLNVSFKADIQGQSWVVVRGEALDKNKKYLFSFTKELSYYSGRDSDGSWSERDDSYSMNLTFPKKGDYYFKINLDYNKKPRSVKVMFNNKIGSHIPHMVFGIILLISAIVINELKNNSIRKMIVAANKKANEYE